jgi:hypothetical protein
MTSVEQPKKARAWTAGWLTILAIATVVAVNAAGLWGIAVATRGAREEEARLFSAETSARARSLESVLSGTRSSPSSPGPRRSPA